MSVDHLRALMESAPDGFFVHDVEGRILDVNERSCLDLGWSRDELLALTINDISSGATPEENAANWARAEPGMAMRLREIARRKDGTTFPVEINLTCQIADGRKLFIGLARDMSEQEADRAAVLRLNQELERRVAERTNELREAREKLQEERRFLLQKGEELGKQAFEDSLTGIANRRRLDQELERACRYAARSSRPVSLAMIDVDFFKAYNDTYGHARGDAALKAVARVIASAARRPYDLAARYGGEEFVLLLPGIDQPEPVFARIAAELTRLELPHAGSPLGPHLTLSFGGVVARALAGVRPADLLSESDRALYRAKKSGRNRMVVTRLP